MAFLALLFKHRGICLHSGIELTILHTLLFGAIDEQAICTATGGNLGDSPLEVGLLVAWCLRARVVRTGIACHHHCEQEDEQRDKLYAEVFHYIPSFSWQVIS